MSVAERPKRQKFGARAVVVDGMRFDSSGEARRWQALKLAEKGGAIHSLTRQVPVVLQVGSKRSERIGMLWDFWYVQNGIETWEDWKGMVTPIFRLKLKMFRHHYPGARVLLSGRSGLKEVA